MRCLVAFAESSYNAERLRGPDSGPVFARTKHEYFSTGDPRFNGSALRVQGEGDVDIGVVLDDGACGVSFSAADVAALGEEV